MLKLFIVSSLILVSSWGWAHGEDQPGPHGGHIRMPGSFHTEMVLDEKNEAHIFLLDMNFQNPTQKDSSIEMKFVKGKSTTPFTCATMGRDHFHCKPTKPYSGKGKLLVTAIRENAKGNEVSYDFPLKAFPKASEKKSEHSHH